MLKEISPQVLVQNLCWALFKCGKWLHKYMNAALQQNNSYNKIFKMI